VQNEEDTGICLFSVLKSPVNLSAEQVPALVAEQKETQKKMLEEVLPIASKRNVPVYTKHKLALRVEEGIFSELNRHKDVRLVLLGYPKDHSKAVMPHNILKEVMMTAERDVAVLRDRNLPEEIQRVLVPVGRGPNARLALQIAMELTRAGNGHVTALRLLTEEVDEERLEDETLQLTETAEEELLEMPENLEIKVLVVESVADGILREAQEGQYDLLIMGAGEEVLSPDRMLGKLNDYLIEEVPCSMLVVRRYQGVGRLWLSKQIKRIEENQEKERLTSAA